MGTTGVSSPSPKSRFPKLACAVCLGPPCCPAQPALAQSNSLYALRDTETEEMLRSYEMPLARAAGLGSHACLSGAGPEINAFATYPDADIFICAGILLWLRKPNELMGVMAHETGHSRRGICRAASMA